MTFTRNDTKAIKGIAVSLMLYHHLFSFPKRIAETIQYASLLSYNDKMSAFLVGEFGKICVALFLFLGGYGTFLSYRKEGNDAARTRVILTKIKSLYKEYWKVFVVFVPICMLAGVEDVTPNIRAMLWNFTGLTITYCGEWWFFRPYVALLFTYPVLHGLLSRERTVFHDVSGVLLLNLFVRFIVPGICACTWAAQLQSSHTWEIFEEMLTYSPSFYMGCIFAKYDLLTKAKEHFSSGFKNWLLAAAAFLATVLLRRQQGFGYDFLLAPVVVAAATILLSRPLFRPLYRLLEQIGRESTGIWLVHSLYCYDLCQELVYFPRYTPLIFLWLLLLSWATSVALRKLFRLGAVFKRRKVTAG